MAKAKGVPPGFQNGLTVEMTQGQALPSTPITRTPIAQTGTLQIPKEAASGVAVTPRPGEGPPKSPWDEYISNYWQRYMANPADIERAAKGIIPRYEARLGGLQGQTMDAMRLSAQQDIQSQYGNALRAAMQQAGAQGIRGPAAVAMQQDIRNQMGQAQARYGRDLTIADWQAKGQAARDLEEAAMRQAGIGIGTAASMQQLENARAGFAGYEDMLAEVLRGQQRSGGGFNPANIIFPWTMFQRR